MPVPNESVNVALAIHRNDDRILDLLWDLHSADCSDPRDKLYAVYGLANDLDFETGTDSSIGPLGHVDSVTPRESRRIKAFVDYGISAETCYIRFAMSCIHSQLLPELLHHVMAFGSLRDRDRTLPSWVPDWSQARRHKGITRRSTFDLMRLNRMLHLSFVQSGTLQIGGMYEMIPRGRPQEIFHVQAGLATFYDWASVLPSLSHAGVDLEPSYWRMARLLGKYLDHSKNMEWVKGLRATPGDNGKSRDLGPWFRDMLRNSVRSGGNHAHSKLPMDEISKMFDPAYILLPKHQLLFLAFDMHAGQLPQYVYIGIGPSDIRLHDIFIPMFQSSDAGVLLRPAAQSASLIRGSAKGSATARPYTFKGEALFDRYLGDVGNFKVNSDYFDPHVSVYDEKVHIV
jgi:hypothetical protein